MGLGSLGISTRGLSFKTQNCRSLVTLSRLRLSIRLRQRARRALPTSARFQHRPKSKRKNVLKASTVLPAIVGMGFVFASGAAQAWIANFPDCNGHDVKWRNTLEVSRNKCSIPDSGDLNEAYWNGVLQWDNLTSEVDGFLVRPADDCSVAIGDGKNEVAIVDPSVIPGLNGDTRTIIG